MSSARALGSIAWLLLVAACSGAPATTGAAKPPAPPEPPRAEVSTPDTPTMTQTEPKQDPAVIPVACCDTVARGVTYSNGKIFLNQLDTNTVALDANTGKELWTQTVVDYKAGHAITSPPVVYKNLVVTGFAGGEYGVRGAVQAYNQNTGELVWKTYTIPAAGEPGNDTWKGDSWKTGGGSTWYVGSYDPR